jgi:MSHA pilin protein MshD
MSTRGADRQRGVSLIELIVFIVVVSAAVAGVLAALNVSTRGSADPLIRKQALAIAEALLEEVQLQPFTFCDPDDDNAAVATKAQLNSAVTSPDVGCATTVEKMGPETETRTSATAPFDNVNDYFLTGGLTLAGISTIDGTPIGGLGAYNATISMRPLALQGVAAENPAGDPQIIPQSLLITVTVTGPGNTTVVLDGYRVRYAPTALP